ncbi:MAG: TIM-barrel domain-containing protein [Colwellia sp.]
MRKLLAKCILAATITTLFSTSPYAKELGDLTSLIEKDNRIEITTSDDELIAIELVKANVFRLWVGSNKKLIEAKDKSAKIVLPYTLGNTYFEISAHDSYQLIQTNELALRVYTSPLRFEVYKADNKTLIFKELKPIDLSDESSYQTLSSKKEEHFFGGGQQNGQFEFSGKNLEVSYSGGWEEFDRPSPAPFYMTDQGYGVLRNTWSDGSYDFRSDDYVTTTHNEARFDAYYFIGDSINTILADYTELSGRAPLIPRWALEYGDADCYNDADNINKPGTVPDGWSDGPTGTTPDVIESVAAKYREHDMPGGWILPNDGYGCGYTDLPKVIAGLKKYGFRTGLWTENGVEKIAWEVGTAGSRAQKLDVAWTGQGYQFSLDANKKAAQGILDNSNSRPFLWTVMGWAGTQRYAVTWTGDQSGSWDYIRWHIPTLIGSGLSGQAYATGDVDGIFAGTPETFTRDLQWKAFTPVLMGMSGWSKAERKHPWWFEEPYRSINRDYLKLKMRLTPYMYTYAKQAEKTGAPIIRGLMWDHPKDPNAFTENYKYQFFLGEDFLVAPVFRSQASSKGWREGIYLPKGNWIDYWDGTVTTAGDNGKVIDYPVGLEKLPLLVKAGAIIPMYPESLYDGQVAKDELTLDIYPHGESSFTLYEDDGETRAYKQGRFSEQRLTVSAPKNSAGDITINIDAKVGNYDGMENLRVYKFQVHTRVQPSSVSVNNMTVDQVDSQTAFDKASSAWWFDANHQYGVVYVKTQKTAVNKDVEVYLSISSGKQLTPTTPYPIMPDLGNKISSDSFIVVSSPLEESGYPIENMFDNNPDTWFRTIRDQSHKTGPHEFVLSFGERKAITGFEIQPRNDKWWKNGQVTQYEIYMSDTNGEWGEPAYSGTLELKETAQKVEFPTIIGRLLRFRVLSTKPQKTKEPKQTDKLNSPYNAFDTVHVKPITISKFSLIEYQLPKTEKHNFYLSSLTPSYTDESLSKIKVSLAHSTDHRKMSMNGLKFNRGLGVRGNSRVDYKLPKDAQLFRADIGIDDSCKAKGEISFQVYGDGKLLFNSGLIKAPTVIKPEIDIRTLNTISLRSHGDNSSCANWANAVIIGFQASE